MQLLGQTRDGDIAITSRGGGVVTIDETYNYIVQADSSTDDFLTVASFAQLPIVGVSVSAGGLAVCKSKTGKKRQENPLIWDFTCSFSSEVEEDSDQQQQQTNTDPTTWVPVRKTLMERVERQSVVDASGARIANSVGQLFSSGITLVRYRPIWEFTQIELATVTDETILSRNEVVNGSTYKGFAAKTLLLIVVESTVGFYYGARRRLTTYRIIYDSEKHTDKRLDTGTVYKSGSDLLPYLDKAGNVINGALDGSGNKQTVGTAPALREFDKYATSSFSFLRI